MKRYFSILPLALIVLALTGCRESRSGPQLTSPDRTERVEAVRDAQNRYGAQPAADRPVPAGDKEALVGRWNHPWTAAAYFRFEENGRYHHKLLLGSIDGSYKLLPNGVIQLNSSDPSGDDVLEMKYRLSGDTLELQQFGNWLAYTRAK
jgi:hypothetical protein